MRRPTLHERICLWVLRLAKLRRARFKREDAEYFYRDFFQERDASACKKDIRRLLRRDQIGHALGRVRGRARVVDLGCGVGDTLESLNHELVRVGLDFSFATVQFARRCLGFGVPLVSGSLLQLPFKTQSVDVAICLEVLEHLEDDRAAVAEIARILKRGGLVVTSVPSHFYFPEYLELMGHWRHYTSASLSRLLAGSGLTVVDYLYTYPRFNRFYFYCYMSLWALNKVSNSISGRTNNLYEMKIPFRKTVLYDALRPALERMARREYGLDGSDRTKDTFVVATKG